jgi:hypothetical protein
MDLLLVIFQIIDVSNAICNSAFRLLLACKTGKWRASWLYGEVPSHPSTEDYPIVTFQRYIYMQLMEIYLEQNLRCQKHHKLI